MIFQNDVNNKPDTHLTLGKYHRYWNYDGGVKSHNPSFDNYSSNILNLKNEEPEAIDYFYNKVSSVFGDNFSICYVPSHDPEKTTSGIRTLAQRIANSKPSITDATSCVVRAVKVSKKATGGNRNVTVQKNSLKVENVHLIKGKNVLLLDDVRTTGNSLSACKQVLEEAGALTVQCLALGQTQWEQ